MILLINTLHSDQTFIADIVDDSILPEDIRTFFDTLPNGYLITNNEFGDWFEETEFDICDYTDGSKIPSQLLSNGAKVDKVINMEY
jgi:hypothetical protein